MKKVVIGAAVVVVLIGGYFIYGQYFGKRARDYGKASVREVADSQSGSRAAAGEIAKEFAEDYGNIVSLYGSLHDKIRGITSLSMDCIVVNAQMKPLDAALCERMDYGDFSALVDQDWHEFPSAAHRYHMTRYHYARDEAGREKLELIKTKLSRRAPVDKRIEGYDGSKWISYSPYMNRAITWNKRRRMELTVPNLGFNDIIGKWLQTAGEGWIYDYYETQLKEARDFITGISKTENSDGSVTYRVSYRIPSPAEAAPGTQLARHGLHYNPVEFTFDAKGRLTSLRFSDHRLKTSFSRDFKDYVERGGVELPTRWISRYFNAEGKEFNGVYTIINRETLEVNAPVKDEFSITLPGNVQLQEITQ